MKWFESLFFLAAQISLSGSKSMSSMVFIIFLIVVNHKNDHFRGLNTNMLPKCICYPYMRIKIPLKCSACDLSLQSDCCMMESLASRSTGFELSLSEQWAELWQVAFRISDQ